MDRQELLAHAEIKDRPTEIWFRNCLAYYREMIETNQYNVAMDAGYVAKRKFDAVKWASLTFGDAAPWRVWIIGNEEQGCEEYRSGHDGLFATYPVWFADTPPDILWAHLENKPKYIVITNLPDMRSQPSRALLGVLEHLQRDFPDTKLHIHGLYSFHCLFGYDFRSVDHNPREDAAVDKLYFYDGKLVYRKQLVSEPLLLTKYEPWVELEGMHMSDMDVPRNRCIFNIKSYIRASYMYKKNEKIKIPRRAAAIKRFEAVVDVDVSNLDFKVVPSNRKLLRNNLPVLGGDLFACDSCTLALDCNSFRKGSVCIVTGSEARGLSKYFNTRNSETILEGLGKIMSIQADRLDLELLKEEVDGKTSKEATKMLKEMFDQGTKLAKLVDPNLRGNSTKVQVNIGGQLPAAPSPKQVISAAIRELELRGIPREQITPEMIKGLVAGMVDPSNTQRAIEGQVVRDEDDL